MSNVVSFVDTSQRYVHFVDTFQRYSNLALALDVLVSVTQLDRVPYAGKLDALISANLEEIGYGK